MVRAIGAERVLFASDYPHWDAKLSGSPQMILERNDLDDDAKRKIMGENAARLVALGLTTDMKDGVLSAGVMEYWGIGVLGLTFSTHSITPLLQLKH